MQLNKKTLCVEKNKNKRKKVLVRFIVESYASSGKRIKPTLDSRAAEWYIEGSVGVYKNLMK